MNQIPTLEAQIRQTQEAIALHQQALAASPSASLSASLQSLQKRLERLLATSESAHEPPAVVIGRDEN